MSRRRRNVRSFDDTNRPESVFGHGTIPPAATVVRMVVSTNRRCHVLAARRLEHNGPAGPWSHVYVITTPKKDTPFREFFFDLEAFGLRPGDWFQVEVSPPPLRVVFDFT